MLTKLKICGICRTEDGLYCAQLGVSYVGFNLIAASPRYLPLATALQLAADISTQAATLGLRASNAVYVVDQTVDPASALAIPADAIIQVHGQVDIPLLQTWRQSHQVWQAVPGNYLAARSLYNAELEAIRMIATLQLFDGPRPGSGLTFDWSHLRSIEGAWGIAGGIDVANLTTALSFGPHLIDVCSGVELAYRNKDHLKLRSLVNLLMPV